MDASARAGGCDLKTQTNGMGHSPPIYSVSSYSTSHGSELNSETIAKIIFDNILNMIKTTGKTNSNDNADIKDTDEEFTLVKSKKRKNKLSVNVAAESDTILRINTSDNIEDGVEISSVESDSENEVQIINVEIPKQ